MKIAVFNLSVTTHLVKYIIRYPEKKLICMHSKTHKRCIIPLLTISLGLFNGSEAGSEVAYLLLQKLQSRKQENTVTR
jgi:hypothetical protein